MHEIFNKWIKFVPKNTLFYSYGACFVVNWTGFWSSVESSLITKKDGLMLWILNLNANCLRCKAFLNVCMVCKECYINMVLLFYNEFFLNGWISYWPTFSILVVFFTNWPSFELHSFARLKLYQADKLIRFSSNIIKLINNVDISLLFSRNYISGIYKSVIGLLSNRWDKINIITVTWNVKIIHCTHIWQAPKRLEAFCKRLLGDAFDKREYTILLMGL